jgi:hypothetical protein
MAHTLKDADVDDDDDDDDVYTKYLGQETLISHNICAMSHQLCVL